MLLARLLLAAVLTGVGLSACSRGPQGDPRDAAPVRTLIQRLDADEARLRQLFDMREELDQARAQLHSSQQELAQDFPDLAARLAQHRDAPVPPAAQGRVRAFRASVAEYDRLVARHNALAQDLDHYLDGRSPHDVQKLLTAMQRLKVKLADMLEDGDYTRAVYVAQHAELVQTLGLQDSPANP